MWLMLLLACSETAPQADPRAYIDAARLAETDAAAAAERCLAAGRRYADDCLAQAAFVAPGNSGDALCEAVQDPFWKDECWFLVAESAINRGESERALERCQQAGGFQDNCITHMWRLYAGALLGEHAPGEAASRYAQTLSWATPQMQNPGLEERFWNKFYEGALTDERSPGLDLAWCDDFPTAQIGDCRRQAPAALKRILTRLDRERAQGDAPMPAAACDTSLPVLQRMQAGYSLRYVASSRLDQVVERHLTRSCSPPRF